MKYDMHCHVTEGSPDSHVTIAEYIKGLKNQGFAGMLVTDHDSYNGYRYYRDSLRTDESFMEDIGDFDVICGIEYDTLEAGHIIVVMPEGVLLPVLEEKGLPVKTLIDLVHAHGGVLGPAHPCDEPFLSIFSTGKYKYDRSIMNKFDFLECTNSGADAYANLRAWIIAKEYDKPTTGGSDAHEPECVGLSYTELNERISDANQFISYIKAGKPTTCKWNKFYGTIKERLGIVNKLLVYGFFPYNKAGALKHTRTRKKALQTIHVSKPQ